MNSIKSLLSPYGTLIVGALMALNGIVDASTIDLEWVPHGAGWQWVGEGAGLIFLRRALGWGVSQ